MKVELHEKEEKMKKIEITFDEKGTHINVNGIGKDEIKSAAYALLHKMHEDFDVSNREIVVIIDDFFYQIEYEKCR